MQRPADGCDARRRGPSADGGRQREPGADPESLPQRGRATARRGRPDGGGGGGGGPANGGAGGKLGLAPGRSPGEQPGQVAGPDLESEDEGEEFDDWEDDYDYPEEEPPSGAGYRVSAALEEANKMFLGTSRAREAALDGGFQMHYEKTPFDQLAFIEELFSLMVVNRLTEELGCDELSIESS